MRLSVRLALALALALALVAVAAAGCGGGSEDKEPAEKKSATKQSPSGDFAGATATPPKPAPPLSLEDSTGSRFDISQSRGKVVFVTWLYVNCPDVCPLIVSNFKVAQGKLGPRAHDVEFIAVSTDPKRDKPRAVNAFLKARGMLDRMRYLVGSAAELGRTWKNWGIVAEPAASNPELIEHSSPIYGISASGRITTLYPANFKPDQIVHDVPLLAKQ